MIYAALASDYDGTVAHDGHMDTATYEALRRLRESGRRLILISGRELKDLQRVCDSLAVFDVLVVENGAVLYFPASGEVRSIAPSPPQKFIAALRAKNIEPLSVGMSVVATWTPNEGAVLAAIRQLGIDWQLIFNKGAVMCLPPGVNKASGLRAALGELKLSACNVVGVGDAENDQAFLKICGCAVAVGNALPAVKESADLVLKSQRGAGVIELIERWQNNASELFGSIRRYDVLIGHAPQGGSSAYLPDDRGAILISGSSGAGKSKLIRLLSERMLALGEQVCIVDPEGDYDNLEGFAHLGDAGRTPTPDELLSLLSVPGTSAVLNLLGTDLSERPRYLGHLLGQLAALRSGSGRPHWIIFDEAHHLMPAAGDVNAGPFPPNLTGTIFLTTEPRHLSVSALQIVSVVIGVGEHAADIVSSYCLAVGEQAPELNGSIARDEALVWQRDGCVSQRIRLDEAKQEHQRHTRKYAEGRLGEDKSFYFRGPEQALNLRAFNLATFLQLAAGVDDKTWLYHLQRGDYSRWFRDAIRDEWLAAEIQGVEAADDPKDSRRRVADLVGSRYAVAQGE